MKDEIKRSTLTGVLLPAVVPAVLLPLFRHCFMFFVNKVHHVSIRKGLGGIFLSWGGSRGESVRHLPGQRIQTLDARNRAAVWLRSIRFLFILLLDRHYLKGFGFRKRYF